MARTRRDKITELGELQLQTLDALARVGEGDVYAVMEQFPEAERPRQSTVRTVLRALEAKGLVTHREEGRTYIYKAAKEPTEVRSGLLGEVVSRVFGGSPSALVSCLLGGETVTEREMARIRELLESDGTQGEG